MLSATIAAQPFHRTMEADPIPAETDHGARDFALMERIGAGDHAAFKELVETHQDAVIGTVAKMLGNPSEAEDIAQQVFLRIWRNAKRYRPDAKFTTYLYTITRNLVFNETRRRSRKKEIPLDSGDPSDSHHEPGDDSHRQPDASLLEAELRIAVDKAIASLPETQRLAVILRRYEDLSYEEIAEVLELSVSAVKSQLFRARSSLREALAGYLNN
jgi:RNA polymerase sigma-70 factor (ECF subfamily)